MNQSDKSEQDIERLLHVAGKRQNPPQDMRDRVYANTLAAWQALPQTTPVSGSRPIRVFAARFAIAAAALVVALAGMYFYSSPQLTPDSAAQVVFVKGGYGLDGEQDRHAATKLAIGSTLQTNPGAALSLRFAGGALVTLDQGTHVTIKADEALHLTHGRIYVDAAGPAVSLAVSTQFAEIVDLGTQYEVVVDESAAQVVVAVREGQVQVSNADHNLTASAGDGIGETLKLDHGALITRKPMATNDPYWDWRRVGRNPYELDGSTVHGYLTWVARDAGYELRFASNAVEQMAQISVLQGRGHSDDTAIDDALAATRFALERKPGGLWVIDFRS